MGEVPLYGRYVTLFASSSIVLFTQEDGLPASGVSSGEASARTTNNRPPTKRSGQNRF